MMRNECDPWAGSKNCNLCIMVKVAPLDLVCNNTLSKSYFDELLL